MLISIDKDKKLILASWDGKVFDNEKICHDLGGIWNSYSQYRFPMETHYIKSLGMRTELRFTPEAFEWIKQESKKRKDILSLSSGDSDAEIPPALLNIYPNTAKALRPYQRAGVKFMTLNDSTLLADHPGTGKTLSTIATMVAAGIEGDILVLGPSAAIQVTWPAEIARWAPQDEILTVVGPRPKREKTLRELRKKSSSARRWVLCNIEMARMQYQKPYVFDGKKYKGQYLPAWPELFFYNTEKLKNEREWASIIIDESHRALITNKTKVHEQPQQRRGISKLVVKKGGKKIAISGTPFRGKIENLWGTLNWLFPSDYPTYWRWIDNWFDTDFGAFNNTEINGLRTGQQQAFYDSIATFTLRRTKAEIAPDLPAKTYMGTALPGSFSTDDPATFGHWLEMEPKQKRAYEQMEKAALAHLESGTLIANGVLAEMTRLKQFACSYGKLNDDLLFTADMPSNKFSWLVQFLDELGINGEPYVPDADTRKVVVASQFTNLIDLFDKELNKLGIETAKITGKVAHSKRPIEVERFQQDAGPRVFLLNTKAGGVSLTLDRADDLVVLDETFIPDDQEQVEDRIHRVSRNHNVFIHYVRSIGTIEEKIARTVFDREYMQKQLLDGTRGVSFARELLQ